MKPNLLSLLANFFFFQQQLNSDFPQVNVVTVEWGNRPISPRASDYKTDLQKVVNTSNKIFNTLFKRITS